MYKTLTTVKLTEHITCMNSGTTEFTEPSRALTDDIMKIILFFSLKERWVVQLKKISHCPLKESGMMLSVT